MRSNRLISVILAALGLAVSALATHKDPSRENQIWAAVSNRLFTQQDIWFDEGDFPTCVQLLKLEGDRFPDNYDVWTNLGWMQENIEDWDGALATYIRYRRNNPGDPDSSMPEAYYFFQKKLYSKIPDLLEPAVKRKGAHPNNFRILASSYEKQKMYSDSIRIWKLYLSVAPTDGAAKANLARVEKKLAAGS